MKREMNGDMSPKAIAEARTKRRIHDMLPNGAIIIRRGPEVNGWLVILAQWRNGEFVTWNCYSETGECQSGEYFRNVTDGAEGFERRVRRFMGVK